MNQIGLFAKFWQPGAVKTRLAASIGAVGACDVYRGFLQHLLDRLGGAGDRRFVVFSPPEREADFRSFVPPDWKLRPQSSGDLGFRMNSFFQQQFAAQQEVDRSAVHSEVAPAKVLIIGADCPQLEPSDIQSAFDRLAEAPVVIGPSSDGGYYLIGMREQAFDIFDDIQWSTETVLARTIDHLETQVIDYRLLPVLTDVDDYQSLVALGQQIDSRHGSTTADSRDDILHQKILTAITLGPNLEAP